MESKSQAMEKAIDGQYYCQRLLHHDIISYTLLDLFACFIIFIIGRWIDNKLVNRFLFLPFLLLPFLFAYLLDKLFPKYITLILSYIYISVCKSILSILKIDFSLVTRNIFHSSTMEKVVSLFSPLSITQRPTIMEKLSHGSLCQVLHKKGTMKILNLLLSPHYYERITLFLFICILFKARRVPTTEKPSNLLSLLSLTQRQTRMEKFSNLLLSAQYYQDSILFLFSSIIMSYSFMALDKFYPKYLAYYVCSFTSHDFPSWVKEKLINNHKEDNGIKRGEVRFVLSNIGISLCKEGDQIKDFMSHEEFSTLFDQLEPGLHEVEEAFSAFDQNRDGFIDAKELQMVLINVGLREGTDVNACQSMIDRHDRNRKGKIDRSDFFKLIESALL